MLSTRNENDIFSTACELRAKITARTTRAKDRDTHLTSSENNLWSDRRAARPTFSFHYGCAEGKW